MKSRYLVSLLLALVIALLPFAIAEVDWSSMDDATIQAEIDNAHAELLKRELVGNTDNIVLFDEYGITIVVKSYEQHDGGIYDHGARFNITVVSESQEDVKIYVDNVAINGWEVDYSGVIDIAAGHKEKDRIEFKLDDADIESIDEMETMEISFYYQDAEKKYIHTEPVIINFK